MMRYRSQGSQRTLTLFRVYDRSVQRIDNTQSLLHAFCQIIRGFARHAVRRRFVAFELELIDNVAKVMVVLVFQVRDQVLE